MKLGAALRLGRVSNLPTTWSNVLSGWVLGGVALSSPLSGGAELLWLLLGISLAYVGGMYLNDAFDRDFDAEHNPERPIPAGEVSAATVFSLGFGMLAASVGVVAVPALRHGPAAAPAIAAALGLAAAIVVYDRFHKQSAAGPLLMGLCRVLVYATAALAVGGRLDAVFWLGASALLAHLIGLTYAARQEHLASFRGGWPLLLLAWPVVLGAAWALLGGQLSPGLVSAALAVWTARCVALLVSDRLRNVPQAITGLIAGISLVDAMLVAFLAPALMWPCFGAFLATRVLQRVVPGT